MSSSSTSLPHGPGSVSGAPNLSVGFTDTFESRYVDNGDVVPRGHWVAEQAPDEVIAALTAFLKPYRDEGMGNG
jgi:hypothetical protein